MKIMMIEPGGFGGIAHYTYNLCQALSNLETVLVTDIKYELENYQRNFSLRKIRKFPPEEKPKNFRSCLKRFYDLYKIILEEKPDMLHFQSILTARKDWFIFMVLKLFGFPIIMTVHNVFPHEKGERTARGMKFALGRIYRFCQHLFVHSEDGKRELETIFGVSGEKISVIPHGNYLFINQNKNLTREAARQNLGLSKNDKVVLCFGAIRKYKGIEYLISAFDKVVNDFPVPGKSFSGTKLVIVGTPINVNIQIYDNLIKQYKLENNIILIPEYIQLKDVPLYFLASDICVFPYLHIYGSGSLQFAYAFSKPVVATKVGSFPEMVKEGKNGYLVPSKDINALAESIIRLLSHPEDIEKMGKYSYHLAETEYSWKIIAGKTDKVYKGMFNENS